MTDEKSKMTSEEPKMLRVAGLAGSLRQGSYNRALLRAARDLAPGGMQIVIHSLTEVPLYNGDVEAAGLPHAVVALRRAVEEADGLLIVTPEYNHGVPAVTKNAVDWLSRPPKPHPLDGKPATVAGATPGRLGTARSQSQLRQSLGATNTLVMPQPQMMVAGAGDIFDDDLRLEDEDTREHLASFLEAFGDWIRRLRPA